MSENSTSDTETVTQKKCSRKRGFFFKLLIIIIIMIIGAISVAQFVLSEKYIATSIEELFKNDTGLNLTIKDLDIEFFRFRITLNGLSATTPENKRIAAINKVTLKLEHTDVIDLLFRKKITIRDLEIFGLNLDHVPYLKIIAETSPDAVNAKSHKAIAQFIENTNIKIESLYITHSQNNTVDYAIKGEFEGQFSGNGIINGTIKDYNTNRIQLMQITGKSENFAFNLEELDINTIYSGDFAIRNNFCDFSGRLQMNKSPLQILKARPITLYEGTGSWNFLDNIIKFPQVKITNKDGLIINAKGDIKYPIDKEKRIIDAQVFNSLVPVESGNVLQNKLRINLNEGFTFSGRTYIGVDKLDINGVAAANNLTLSNAEHTTNETLKGSITTNFEATKEALHFSNIQTSLIDNISNSELSIPISTFKEKNNAISCLSYIKAHITFKTNTSKLIQALSKLSFISSNTYIPSGDLSAKLLLTPTNTSINSFKLTVSGIDKVTINSIDSAYEINFDNLAGQFTGTLNKNGNYHINDLQIRSKPLYINTSFSKEPALDAHNFKYNIDADILKLKPFLPNSVLPYFSEIARVKASATGSYSPETAIFSTTNNTCELFFKEYTNPSSVLLTGNFSLIAKDNFHLKLPKGTLSVIETASNNNSKNTAASALLQLDTQLFKIDASNNSQFSPSGSLTAGIRSTNSAFLNVLLKLTGNSRQNLNIKKSTIRAKINFDAEEADCLFKIESDDLAFGKPVIFTADSISIDSRSKYDISSKKLLIEELQLSDPAKKFQLIASGNIYTENMIFDNFHCKLSADLAILGKNFRDYARSHRSFSGDLTLISELTGTANDPSLTVVGKSPIITITESGYSKNIIEPKVDAQLHWNRDFSGKILGLRVDNIFIQSNDGAFYLSGGSDTLELKKHGYVDFGKGCTFDYAFKGNRSLLWFISPELITNLQDIGTKESIEVSGNLQAKALPLLRLNKESEYDFIRSATINRGKFKLDKLQYNKTSIDNIQANFSLQDSIITVTDGNADIAGKVAFTSTVDFSKTPTGRILLNIKNTDLAKFLSNTTLTTPVINGWLQLPDKSKSNFTEISWSGNTLHEIINNLKSPRTNAKISDLVIETIAKRQDWEKLLSEDFPPSLAHEIAKRIDSKLSPSYGKKEKNHYKFFNTEYIIGNKQFKIMKIYCGGGNTADFLTTGVIAFDGRLKLRLYPIGNIHKTFDINSLLQTPAIQGLVANLPPEAKKKFFQILPNRLEQLAKSKKLFIDISGNVSNPLLNFDSLRRELRSNIPSILNEFKAIMGGGNSLINILLGNQDSIGSNSKEKDINNISNMGLGDLLKFIE